MLGFIVARALYDRYPEFSEGQLSKVRAHVVSRRTCAVVAAEIGLDRRLAEHGRVAEDLQRSGNVLAALMEAVLAALYLEHGLEPIAGAVVGAFEARIEEALTEDVDQKTALQEELARRGLRVEYVTLETEGPPHDRTFRCAALVEGEQVGTGTGRTKKDAEQAAAREALVALGVAA